MCRPASMIVTRTEILIGSSDSHRRIAEEHGLVDDGSWVPIEIYPDDWDYRRSPSEWRIHTDLPRDLWPEWYSEAEAEIACREMVSRWARNLRIGDWSCTPELAALPDLPACEHLVVRDCTALAALPALPACMELDVRGCTALAALPDLPACSYLYVCRCTALAALPALPACESLYASGCIALVVLPDLPACEILVVSRCTALVALPALPVCMELDVSGCTVLAALPVLPAGCFVLS
jgi:hypothetical protein